MSAPVVTTYEHIAELPLTIEDYELEGRERSVSPEFTRLTTTFHLRGRGQEGLGEDVTYDPDEHREQQARGATLPLAGDWTFDSFARHVGELDLFPAAEPQQSAYRLYRRWGIESAALDLALRQAGRSLGDVLGREHRPVSVRRLDAARQPAELRARRRPARGLPVAALQARRDARTGRAS